MSSPADGEENDRRRRWLLLAFVALLVILGAGIGSIILGGPLAPGDGSGTTPTPTDDATATPTPDGSDSPTGTDRSTATPEDTGTPPPDDADRTATATPERGTGEEGDSPSSPGLVLGDDGPFMSAENLHPSESGHGTLSLRNAADEDGNLTIRAIAVRDEENGLTDPEAAVDSTTDSGELSEHLEVRLSVRDADGAQRYLLGTDGGYVTLSDLPARTPSAPYRLASGETVTLVADWRLPSSVGNEVQSDGVRVDLEFSLVGIGG